MREIEGEIAYIFDSLKSNPSAKELIFIIGESDFWLRVLAQACMDILNVFQSVKMCCVRQLNSTSYGI